MGQTDAGEPLEEQRDGQGGVIGVEVAGETPLLGMTHRRADDVHAVSAEPVLQLGKSGLGGRELLHGDHDADVGFEHVPVDGDGGVEEIAAVGQFRKFDDVAQEVLGQCGEQVLFVAEVAVEHGRGFAGRRGDVGQRGGVETTLDEQFSGGVFDGLLGLAALAG